MALVEASDLTGTGLEGPLASRSVLQPDIGEVRDSPRRQGRSSSSPTRSPGAGPAACAAAAAAPGRAAGRGKGTARMWNRGEGKARSLAAPTPSPPPGTQPPPPAGPVHPSPLSESSAWRAGDPRPFRPPLPARALAASAGRGLPWRENGRGRGSADPADANGRGRAVPLHQTVPSRIGRRGGLQGKFIGEKPGALGLRLEELATVRGARNAGRASSSP